MSRELEKQAQSGSGPQVSDADIREAMKEIPGYLDITPADLREVYSCAYRHALERITGSVHARDIMTTGVHAVQMGTSLRDVAAIMAANRISGVPVIDARSHVLGIISEKDFCANMGDRSTTSLMGIIADCLKNKGCFAMTLSEKSAGDIMHAPAITVPADATLMQIKNTLAQNNINRVPVVDSERRLIGIISRADIVRLMF